MDFSVENHGSIAILNPESDAAREWVEEHLPEDRQEWGSGVVVEPRYLGPILEGIVADGLEVSA